MTIREAEEGAAKVIQAASQEKEWPIAGKLLSPPGFRVKVELQSLPKKAGALPRKKRSTADFVKTFDPRTDQLVIRFEREEGEESEVQEEVASASGPMAIGGFPPASPSLTVDIDLSPDRIRTAVLSLDKAESSHHQFVGLKFFRDRLLTQEKYPWVQDEGQRQVAIRELIRRGVMERGQVPNPQTPDFPVSTVKLNRNHPDVIEILGSVNNRPAPEFRPIPQSGERASRIILKDRR